MHNMGSHLAFVGMCKHTAGQLMAKHGQHMGSQKAFGSKLSFWPAGCWHLGMVKLSLGPPVWLAQVTLME